MADPIRVLIADDHPVVRRGLRAMLQDEPDIRVAAEAADGETALALIKEHTPDVAVLDIDMPKLNGFGVAQQAGASTRIIFLTLHAEYSMFRDAMEAGASGYLLKDSAMMEIVTAVRAVAEGRKYYSAEMTERAMRAAAGVGTAAQDSPASRLTNAERRILELIAEGQSSKEIGATLSIHYRTVENHRNNICRKLGLEGSNALLRFALQNKSGR
jgi:DNA-binding NarL/FixJ family response regulator